MSPDVQSNFLVFIVFIDTKSSLYFTLIEPFSATMVVLSFDRLPLGVLKGLDTYRKFYVLNDSHF